MPISSYLVCKKAIPMRPNKKTTGTIGSIYLPKIKFSGLPIYLFICATVISINPALKLMKYTMVEFKAIVFFGSPIARPPEGPANFNLNVLSEINRKHTIKMIM